MKKILLLLLMIGSFAQAQNVNIPDANFKNVLISRNCVDSNADNIYDSDADTNNDGEIQIAEAHAVINLNLYAAIDIADLTGINDFINLAKLSCSGHNLTTLSISNLNNLISLDCSANTNLTSLNFLNLNSLTTLKCSWTSLGVLDVTGLSNLRELECNSSGLSGINIANLSNLESLSIFNNQLTTIDFTGTSGLKTIVCSYNQLSGIDMSPVLALQTLDCNDNLLVNLDVSNNVLLRELNCSNNNLTSINVSGLSNLDKLNIDENQLSNISLMGLINLTELSCSVNQLTSLNLAGLISLQILGCNDNQLTVLNLAGLTSLRILNCHDNQISTLDFAGLLNLQGLGCWNNMLTSLDFSNNPVFGSVNCGNNNNLQTINLKNGYNHFNVDNRWDNNPNLSFVCIDEGEASVIDWIMSQSSLPNVVVNTYCSFTPGGDYNTITGNVIFDIANDGCDVTDLPQLFVKVKINDGTTEGASFGDENANYVFYTQAGNFTVTPDVENPSFFNFSPVNAVINFPDNNNNLATQNFCVTANGVHPDLEIVIAPVIPARPGFDAVYKIVYKNKGNQVLSQPYGINFFYNQNLLTFVSATQIPDSQNPGAVNWNYSNLMPFESRSIEVTMHVNSPTDVNPVNSGDELQLTASILPMAGDETTQDNLFQFNQTVINSYDPNDKYCLEGEVESPVKIGEYLHYTINFENVGTADAVNVVVKDVIDTTKFDEKSLQIMNSSHPVEAKIRGNVAEFVFQNIDLAAVGNGGGGGGHGNILLKIRTKTDLQVGDVATNKADIFFDYNAPIETNLASTVFQSLSVSENVIDNSVSVYPNPTSDKVVVKSNNAIKSIQLFDVQGRLLFTRMAAELTENIDLTSKATGLYFMKIVTTQGIKVEKILKK